jgi:hypothetical protein
LRLDFRETTNSPMLLCSQIQREWRELHVARRYFRFRPGPRGARRAHAVLQSHVQPPRVRRTFLRVAQRDRQRARGVHRATCSWWRCRCSVARGVSRDVPFWSLVSYRWTLEGGTQLVLLVATMTIRFPVKLDTNFSLLSEKLNQLKLCDFARHPSLLLLQDQSLHRLVNFILSIIS